MSRDGSIELDFGDGRHTFRLAIGELEELQDKTQIGPNVLLARLRDGAWNVADVAQTIRLGLIGGGMKPGEALVLTRRYVEQRPDWVFNSTLAFAIVGAAISGVPGEEVGKTKGPRGRMRRKPRTDASPSDPITPTDA